MLSLVIRSLKYTKRKVQLFGVGFMALISKCVLRLLQFTNVSAFKQSKTATVTVIRTTTII